MQKVARGTVSKSWFTKTTKHIYVPSVVLSQATKISPRGKFRIVANGTPITNNSSLYAKNGHLSKVADVFEHLKLTDSDIGIRKFRIWAHDDAGSADIHVNDVPKASLVANIGSVSSIPPGDELFVTDEISKAFIGYRPPQPYPHADILFLGRQVPVPRGIPINPGLPTTLNSYQADWLLGALVSVENEPPTTESLGVYEGHSNYVRHRHRERSQHLRSRKVKEVRAERGCIACEVCGFDFERAYPLLGINFIEVHHTTPLSTYTTPSVTRLSDLALLCANCHRMAHREGGQTVAELQRLFVAHATSIQ